MNNTIPFKHRFSILSGLNNPEINEKFPILFKNSTKIFKSYIKSDYKYMLIDMENWIVVACFKRILKDEPITGFSHTLFIDDSYNNLKTLNIEHIKDYRTEDSELTESICVEFLKETEAKVSKKTDKINYLNTRIKSIYKNDIYEPLSLNNWTVIIYESSTYKLNKNKSATITKKESFLFNRKDVLNTNIFNNRSNKIERVFYKL